VTFFRHRVKSFVWVALVAMCGLAFGPSISRALGGGAMGAGAMHADCAGMGAHAHMSTTAAGGRTESPKPQSSDPTDCCALCVVAASALATLSFTVPKWKLAEVARVSPTDFSSARPARRDLWSRAVPHGPPFVS